MIKLTNICQTYDGKKALNNINLEFPDSGFFIIYGGAASGKTSLVNIIGSAIEPSEGTVEVDGKVLDFANKVSINSFRESDVSFIYTNANLFDNMTAEENIRIVGDNPKFDEVVTKLGIKDILSKKAKNLGSNEKSLVSIARGILKESKILIVDEPTATIDAKLKPIIYDLLKETSASRLVIATTKDKVITENYGDTIINIKSGVLNEIYSKFETAPSTLTAGKHQNKFNLVKFAFKNLFSSKTHLIPTTLLLIIGMISVFIATALLKVDFTNLHTETMSLESETSIFITKKDKRLFEESEISELSTKLQTPISVGRKINIENQYIKLIINQTSANSSYYNYLIQDMTFYSIDDCPALIAGDLPSNANDMVVTEYLADLIISKGVKDMEGDFYKPSSYEELVSSKHELFLAAQPVVITGISKMNNEKYEPLKTKDNEFLKNLANKYFSLTAEHVYVQDSFFDLYENYHPALDKKYVIETSPGHMEDEDYVPGKVLKFNIFTDPVRLKRSDVVTDYIAPEEIIINGSALNATGLKLEEVIDHEMTLYFESMDDYTVSEPHKYRVIGISEDGNNYMNIEGMREFLVDPFTTDRVEISVANEQKIERILEEYKEDETYKLETTFASSLIQLEEIGTYALYITAGIGAVLLLVSIFFIKSYITNSIDEHMRDIAVLQLFGIDTKKINLAFIIENVVILLGCYILSSILFFIARPIIGLIIKGIYTLQLNIIPIVPLYYLLAFLAIALLIGLSALLINISIKKINPNILFKVRRNNMKNY